MVQAAASRRVPQAQAPAAAAHPLAGESPPLLPVVHRPVIYLAHQAAMRPALGLPFQRGISHQPAVAAAGVEVEVEVEVGGAAAARVVAVAAEAAVLEAAVAAGAATSFADVYGSLADWIAAIAALVTAFIAAYLGLVTFKHQRTSADVQLALGLFSSINCYWDRVTDSSGANFKYDMGQILAHFELAATFFNNKTLTARALPILKDHIVEVFTAIQVSAEGKHLIETCRSSPNTFKELRAFAAEHMPTALQALSYCEDKSSKPEAP